MAHRCLPRRDGDLVGLETHRAVGDVDQAVVVGLGAPGGARIGVVADLHRPRRVGQVEDSQPRVVGGPVQQPVPDPRVVRAEDLAVRRRLHAEGVDQPGLRGVGDIDDVEAPLPAAELLVAVDVVPLGPGAVDALGEGQIRQQDGRVGFGEVEEDQPGLVIADDGEAAADEDVVREIAEAPLVLPGAGDHGGGRIGDVDDAQARAEHVSEIESVAVDEEIVDAAPAGLLEPGELDGIGRIGDVEDQQPEVGVVVGIHLLYPDCSQITRDLDVHRGFVGADLGHLAHVDGVGDVDEVDDAAKVAHQRVVPGEVEVRPPGHFPLPGKGDEDDLADAFHPEAVGVLVGGLEGGEGLLAGGLGVSARGRGHEEDQQRERGSPCESGPGGVHGWSSWIQGRGPGVR